MGILGDKIQGLRRAKENKINLLSGDVALAGTHKDPAYIEDNGTLYNAGNKITNNLTPEDVQYLEGYMAADRQILQNDDGSLYRTDTPAQAFTGDTGTQYQFGANEEGVTKVGKSLGYLPDAQGNITNVPAEARYIPGTADGLLGRTIGRDGYGWKAGPAGVNVDDKQMGIKYSKADNDLLEGVKHWAYRDSRTNQRVDGSTAFEPGVEDSYGSGKSEYYNEGFAGDTSKSELTADEAYQKGKSLYDELTGQKYVQEGLDSQVHIPNTAKEVAAEIGIDPLKLKDASSEVLYELVKNTDNEELKSKLHRYAIKEAIPSDTTSASDQGWLEGTTKALGSGFTKELAVDFVDFVGDATGLYDVGNEDEKTEMVNDWFNYTPTTSEETHKKVAVLNNVIWDSKADTTDRLAAVAESIYEAAKDGEMLGSSLGVIAAWFVPGVILTKGDKAVKAYKAIDKLVNAGELSAKAGAKKKLSILGSKEGVKTALKKQTGQITGALGNVNDQYETWVANNNGVGLEGMDKMVHLGESFGIQMLNQNLDAITAVSVIKAPGLINAAKQSIQGISDKAFGQLITGIGKAIGSAAFVQMPKEAGQEYIQKMMELVNERYGSEKFKDLDSFVKFLTDEGVMKEGTVDALMGAGGSVQFQAIGAVPNLVKSARDKVTKARDTNTEDTYDVENDPIVTNEKATSRPIYDDIMGSATKEEADEKFATYMAKSKNDELAPEELQQVIEAYKESRQAEVKRKVESGESLGATPQEEQDLVNAYFMIEDETEAATFRDKAEKLNPEMKSKFEVAGTEREMYKELGGGRYSVREEVVSKGMDGNRLGFRAYFRQAITADTEEERIDAINRLEKFTDSQRTKITRLDAIKEESEQKVVNKINNLARKLGKSVTEEDVMKAALVANNVLDGAPKGYYQTMAKVLEAMGHSTKTKDGKFRSYDDVKENLFKYLEIKTKTEGKYASAKGARRADESTPGVFTAEDKKSLVHVASRYGLTPKFAKVFVDDKGNAQSQVTKRIDEIAREVTSMEKAKNLVAKRVAREAGVVEEGEVEVEQETPTEQPTTARDSLDEGPQSDYQKVKGDELVQPTTEDKPVELSDARKKWVNGAIATGRDREAIRRVIDANSKLTADERIAMSNYLDEQMGPVVEETVQDTPPDIVGEEINEYAQTIQDTDTASMSEEELVAFSNKIDNWNTSKYDEASVKAIQSKREQVKQELADYKKKRHEKEAKRKDKLQAKIDELTGVRDAASKKLEQVKESVADIKEATKDIQAKYEERAAVRNKLKEAMKEVDKANEDVELATNEMNGILQNTDSQLKGITIDDIGLIEKSIAAIKKVNNTLGSAMEAFIARVKELLGIVSKYSAMARLLKDEEKKLSDTIRDMEAVVTYELNDEHWKDRRSKAKKDKAEQVAIVKDSDSKIKKLKEELKGTAYTAEMIKDGKKGSRAKVRPTTAEVEVPLDMSSVLVASKASTTLGNQELTDAELAELGITTADMQDKIGQLGEITDTKLAKYTYLMMLLNKDNTINKNTLAAMVVATDNYIGENLGSLEQVTKKDIESMYGINDLATVENAGKYYAGGIPRDQVVRRIAGDIMNMLGVNYKGIKDEDGNIVDTQEELYEKISVGLANAAVQDAIDSGKLQVVPVDKDGDKKPWMTLKFTQDTLANEKTIAANKMAVIDRLDKYEALLGLEKPARTIKTEAGIRTVEDAKAIKRNDYTEAATMSAEAIVKEEQTAWRPNREVIGGLVELGEESLKKLLGYKEVSTAEALEEQLSTKGKNRQIQDDIDNLMILWNAMEDGTVTDEMYFDWFISKNGRLMIDAKGGFNPQAIKLHRYSAYKDGMKGTVEPDDEAAMQIYKLGIAQSMGYAIDKKDVKDSIAYAEVLLETEGALDEVLEAMKNPQSIEHNWVEAKPGKWHIEVAGVEIEIEEPAHAMQAITEGKKYKKDEAFDTVMTLEVDGLTNGFAHKMLQYLITKGSATSTEITPEAMIWLEKVGIRVKEGESLGDISARLDQKHEEAIVDAYWTLGGELTKGKGTLADKIVSRYNDDVEKIGEENALGKALKGFTGAATLEDAKKSANALLAVTEKLTEVDENGETVMTKAVRNLMKYPFMTWGYQAGFKSIANTISSALIGDVAKQIVEYDGSNKEIATLVEGLGIGSIQEVQKRLLTETYGQVGAGSDRGSFEKQFREQIKAVYGDAIQVVMEDTFGGVMEINNSVTQSTKVMFELFDSILQDHMKDGVLPKDELVKLVKEELWDVFPLIEGPLSDSEQNYIPAVTDKMAPARDNKYGPIQVFTGKEGEDSYTSTTRKTLGEPGVGIGVGLTHNEDAAGTVMNMLRHDLLQVFDAYVIGVNQSDAISDANKDFAEMNMREDWSQIKAVEQGLQRVISNLEKLLGKDEAQKRMNGVHKKLEDEAIERAEQFGELTGKRVLKIKEGVLTPAQQLAEIANIRKANDARRGQLADKEVDIQQFVHDEATGYVHEGDTKKVGEQGTVDNGMIGQIESKYEGKFENSKVGKELVKEMTKDKYDTMLEVIKQGCK